MKKAAGRNSDDDIRPEYDLASLGPGVRGKYAGRLRGTVLVALRPEVAEAFPTADAVNEALCAVIKATTVMRRPTILRKPRGGPKRPGSGRSRLAVEQPHAPDGRRDGTTARAARR